MNQNLDPELQPWFALTQEINRRLLAERVDTTALSQYVLQALQKLSNDAPAQAITTWLESFDYHDNVMQERERIAQLPPDQRRQIRWCWPSWNALLDPFEPGTLAVVAGGDGMGKTVIAEQLAEYWASQKFNVIFVHFELSKKIMFDRRASRNAGITRRTLQKGILDSNQSRTLRDVADKMRRYQGSVTYLHTPGWTPERTIQGIRGLADEGLCDVVVIDYLEKVAASDAQLRRYSNPYQREADTVEQFKSFAEMQGVPVLMLAQLNKQGKAGEFTNLVRTDIRGAGEKTEKANIVLLLYRPRNENGDYEPVMQVRIDKNTLGQTGSFSQYFDGRYFRVADFKTED